jgi:hypothetical protein
MKQISEKIDSSEMTVCLLMALFGSAAISGPGGPKCRHLSVLFLLPPASLLDPSPERQFFLSAILALLIFGVLRRQGLTIAQQEVEWIENTSAQKEAGAS